MGGRGAAQPQQPRKGQARPGGGGGHPGLPGEGECRRAVSLPARRIQPPRALEGEKPGDDKGAAGLGAAGAVFSPEKADEGEGGVRPRYPSRARVPLAGVMWLRGRVRPWLSLEEGVGGAGVLHPHPPTPDPAGPGNCRGAPPAALGQELALGGGTLPPPPKGCFGDLVCDPRAPGRGDGDRQRAGGTRGMWPLGLRPPGGGEAAVGWGTRLPVPAERDGGKGKGREAGGGCPAVPSAGPRGVFRAVGSAGAGGPAGGARVPWKILCPAPASGAQGWAGRGARREPQSEAK